MRQREREMPARNNSKCLVCVLAVTKEGTRGNTDMKWRSSRRSRRRRSRRQAGRQNFF